MTSKRLASLLDKAPRATVRGESSREAAVQPVPPIAPEPVRDKEVALHVLVPAHVRKQVDILGAQQSESLRTIVLRGLRSVGIEVSDEEIRGGHKRERRS